MPLRFQLSLDGSTATLAVSGRFTFADHKAFRQIIDGLQVESFIIDLEHTSYIDSSALGLMLIARDRLAPAKISIHNAHGTVEDTLKIANFQKVFTIE